MGEERIKSDDELKNEQVPLSPEELGEVAGGGAFHESSAKGNSEQEQKNVT
jgi:hypothetical protein